MRRKWGPWVEGDVLRQHRLGLKMTQAGFAQALGVAQGTISRWEAGTLRIERPRQLSLAIAKLEDVQLLRELVEFEQSYGHEYARDRTCTFCGAWREPLTECDDHPWPYLLEFDENGDQAAKTPLCYTCLDAWKALRHTGSGRGKNSVSEPTDPSG